MKSAPSGSANCHHLKSMWHLQKRKLLPQISKPQVKWKWDWEIWARMERLVSGFKAGDSDGELVYVQGWWRLWTLALCYKITLHKGNFMSWLCEYMSMWPAHTIHLWSPSWWSLECGHHPTGMNWPAWEKCLCGRVGRWAELVWMPSGVDGPSKNHLSTDIQNHASLNDLKGPCFGAFETSLCNLSEKDRRRKAKRSMVVQK